MNSTPLRYPGGKSMMSPFFEEIIDYNKLTDITYAEPYAGGAGSAINLLVKNKVHSIIINDISIGIYSFWYFLINESEKFLDLFHETPVTLTEWKKQKNIFDTSKKPSLKLGFSTFFLSRTNRSGILNAGPMGGQSEQKQSNAKYKIDCRYNRKLLLKKFNQIIALRKNIKVYNYDALTFLKKYMNDNTFIYLDPPYYKQGKALYLNYYKHHDHHNLSLFLKENNDFNWVLSYDNVDEIKDLYNDFNLYEFDLTYTAQKIKKGTELFTHSSNINIPENPIIKCPVKKIALRKIK